MREEFGFLDRYGESLVFLGRDGLTTLVLSSHQ